QQCPPLAHPPVLSVAAATNPCQAKAGESAELVKLRVVKTYQRSQPPAPGRPDRYPLRCGDAGFGYLHLLDALAKGRSDHGDPATASSFDELTAYTVDQGIPSDQAKNTWRPGVRSNAAEGPCHNGDWGFRVVVAMNPPPHPPFSWKSDGLPVGIITAFRLPK